MSGRCSRSSIPSSIGAEPIECMVNLSAKQLNHGDVVWSRINGESWWPVQVSDEKCVACKPKKKKNGQVLVRLYGTSEHIYVDPANCVLKIEKIFGQENSSNREVFQKFLEDLTRMKSGGQSAAAVSKSKEILETEKERDESTGGKMQTKGKLKRTMIADNSLLDGSSDNPKAAKQTKVLKSEAIDVVKASEVGITKRRTRGATFKARNEGTSVIEVSNETENLNSGTSTICSSDRKDKTSSKRKGAKERLTLNLLDKASESNCLKQDCERNPDVNKIEISDAKDIKKLVAKIVKEVAEKARNEALKGKGMEICLENDEYMDSSRKKSSDMKNMKGHIPRRVKDNDIEVHNTERGIDDTQDRAAGPSDAEKLSNGSSFDEVRDFHCECNERTKDTDIKLPSVVERESNEIQIINDGDKKSQSNFTMRGDEVNPSETNKATSGDQRGNVIKEDVSSEKMDGPNNTTECFLSPRCTKVMQSLGLIAPLGSPFCRNGLINSLLP